MAGELFVYSFWARERVMGVKVGKPPLISWLKSAEDDEVVAVVGVVGTKADADEPRAQSATRMELPIFIL